MPATTTDSQMNIVEPTLSISTTTADIAVSTPLKLIEYINIPKLSLLRLLSKKQKGRLLQKKKKRK